MVLVIAEQRGGKLNRATWETVAAAQQAGGPVAIAVLGAGAETAAAELAAADVANVIVVEAAAVAEYTADGYVLALAALVAQEQPALVFLSHT
jgi:electron transfer flavoprotein alpha subunit